MGSFHSAKEEQDVVGFNIAQYMMHNNMSMMSPEDALKKEQEEYIDAKNKQDVAEKQVRLFCYTQAFLRSNAGLLRESARLKFALSQSTSLFEHRLTA